MKVYLHTALSGPPDYRDRTRSRRMGAPFFVNRFGWLTHRVRAVRDHLNADGGNVRRPTNTKTGNAFAVATLLRDGALILNVLGHAESAATEVLLHWMEIARERINTEQPQK